MLDIRYYLISLKKYYHENNKDLLMQEYYVMKNYELLDKDFNDMEEAQKTHKNKNYEIFHYDNKANKKVVYLDYNIFEFCRKNLVFFKSMEKLKEKYQFVYSPANLEEVERKGIENERN